MAADAARADRIRELKLAHPDLTWKAIAEHVGVAERSAIDWQKTGGIEYEHAKKLAELFPEVSLDYLWRGEAPDLIATMNGDVSQELQDQLDRIEQRQLELLNRLDAIITRQDLRATTPPTAAPADRQEAGTRPTSKTRRRARRQAP